MKAVESSTVVAFRALVMLACLVVAPLAAIFGSTFPDVVRKWLINPLMAQTDSTAPGVDSAGRPIDRSGSPPLSYSHDGNGAEHPTQGLTPFWQPPAMAAAPNGLTPLGAGPGEGPNLSPVPAHAAGTVSAGVGADGPINYAATSGLVSPAGAAAPGDQRGATQAAFSTPIGATPPQAAGVNPGQTPAAAAPVDPFARPQTPAGFVAGSAPMPASGSAYGAPPAAEPAARAAGESEHFAWYEKKLREYGAAYYLLETWGNEGELYRFHCKMAVAGNQTYTRHFEATDRDKLQAMAKVLEQVEAWRGGRLP